MRNLKRALSLALAAVMVLGMMVVGAGAVSYDEFTDKDDIVNTEAVSVLNTLNVIVGKDTGAFDPTGIVTRGEMAKIICIMLNGGEEPVLGVKDKPSFSDIKGHWAEKYIEYCAGLNVIAGRGNGKFDPDATVTGTEAAKMFLTALGYDAKVFSFTGNEWSINVNTKANEPGVELYTRLKSLDPALGLTRDNTAQMAYNTLNAKVLKITPSKTLTTGEVVYEYIQDTTFLEAKFSITKYTGELLSNDTYGLGGTSGKGYSEVFVRTVNGEDVANYSYTIRTTADSELLGQEVVVFEKKNITGEKVVVGDVFATERNTVISTFDALDPGTDSTKKDTIARFVKTNGLKLDDYGRTPISGSSNYNYFGNTIYFVDNVMMNFAGTPVTAANLSNGRGEELVLIDNNADGVVDYVLQTRYQLAKVTSKDDTAKIITLNTGKLVDDTDMIGYDDVAKDDIVLFSVKNGIYDVSKSETMEGAVSAYTEKKNLTVDDAKYSPTGAYGLNAKGDPYSVNNVTTGGVFTVDAAAIDGKTVKLGGTYRFYLDKGGNPVAAMEIESTSNYALVLDSGVQRNAAFDTDKSGYNATVKLMLSDGTMATYPVDLLATANNYYTKALDGNATGTLNPDDATPLNRLAIKSSDENIDREYKMAQLLANSLNTLQSGAVMADAIQGTLVSVNVVDDSTVVLAPTSNAPAYAATSQATAAIPKGVTYWTAGGKGYVMNSSTKFFASGSPTTGSVITGVQNIPSGGFSAADVVSFDFDTTTKVVKAVYINKNVDAAKSHVYVTSGPSVTTSSNGTTVYRYTGVLSDGTVVTLDSKSNVGGNKTAYSYSMDGNYANLVKLSLTGSVPVDDRYFSGVVTAIDAEAITLTDKDGNKINVAVDSTNMKTWNVVDGVSGEAATAIELSQSCQATIIFTKKDGNVVVDAAYVTSLPTTYTVYNASGVEIGKYLPGTVVPGYGFTMPAYDVYLGAANMNSAQVEALLASGNAIVQGNVTVDAELTVPTGKTLLVTGNLNCTGGKLTSGTNSTIQVSGDATLANASKINGRLSVGGKLTTGNATLNGTTIAGSADVTGGTINGPLEVAGALTSSAGLTVVSSITAGSMNLTSGNLALNDGSSLTVEGAATVAGTTTVGEASGSGATLTLKGVADLKDNITVDDKSVVEITSNVALQSGKNLTIGDEAKLTVNGNLDVQQSNAVAIDNGAAVVVNGDYNATGKAVAVGAAAAASLKVTGTITSTTGAVSVANGGSLTAGTISTTTGTVSVATNGTLNAGTITASGAGTVTVNTGTLTATGAITTSNGAVTLTAGTLNAGSITTGGAGVTLTAGTLTVTGAITTGGGVVTMTTGTLNAGSITVGAGTFTVSAGTAKVTNNVDKVTDVVASATLEVGGNVTTVTDTNGTLTIAGDVTALTKMTAGTLTVGGDITSDLTNAVLAGGTLKLGGDAALSTGAPVSAIELGSGAKLTIKTTAATPSGKLSGVAGAQVVVASGQAPAVIASDNFYAHNSTTAIAGNLTAGTTYVYGTYTNSTTGTTVTGFIATA